LLRGLISACTSPPIAQHIVIKKYKNISLVVGLLSFMAVGIWSMHFVGMLHSTMDTLVSYDPLGYNSSFFNNPAFCLLRHIKGLIKQNLSICNTLLMVYSSGVLGAMNYIRHEANGKWIV